MSGFTIALAAFVLLHIGISATGLRASLVKAIGERAFRIVFSIATLALLIWLVRAYGDMRVDRNDPLNEYLWFPPVWTRPIGQALILIGFLLGIAGLFAANPTMVGFEKAITREEPARGMLRITRHPFMWGVMFWALGHVIMNGERFAIMLFSVLGLVALFGTRSIDRKTRARDPEHWARFEAVTSNIPFAAIVQGRNKFVISEIWWRLLVALAICVAAAFAHETLIGRSAFYLSI